MSLDFDRSEPGFDVLHRVSEDVYTYTTHFLFMGNIPIHNRSIVVRIPPREAGAEGTLVIINPVELRPEVKWKMVRNAEAVQRSFERILTWDFDRYLSIHGDPGNMLERGAKAQVADLLAWSKAPPAP